MININKSTKTVLLLLLAAFGSSKTSLAQCYETLGSSTSVFSTLANRTNQIIVNNDLNTVIFSHRNDISVFGGTAGTIRYDISTDNGNTWQLNQGVLNPNSTDGVNAGRFQQVGIYNPTDNTNPANAQLVYHASTLGANGDWNGYVTGSLLLDGAAAPTENYNQAGVSNTLFAGGFCQSTPGTFWTIDAVSNNDQTGEGIRILKGTYGAGDVAWAVNTELTPDFNLDSGGPQLADWNMAFDPSGMIGWVALLTHLNGAPDKNYHPVFYNTTDGGATWNGPIQLEPAAFSSVTSVVSNPACATEIDITVDANGHPHALVGVFERTGDYNVNQGAPGNLFDFTYDGSSWHALNVARTSHFSNLFLSNAVTYDRVKMSRSDDGTKIVFTWVEIDLPFTATFSDFINLTNQQANLKAVTYDVPTGALGCPVIYSIKCPSILNGTMFQTSVSPNLLEDEGGFRVPVVVTVTNASGSAFDPVQFYYLNDLSFTASDFTAVNTPTYPTISVDGTVPFCYGNGDVELTASAAGSYLWSTGDTTQSIHVTDGGNYWVVNPDQGFCRNNSNSVYLYAVQPFYSFPYANPVLCPNGATSVDISVFSWNELPANSVFTWNTGDTTNTLTVTAPGTYIPYIDGCPAIDSVVVTAPGALDNDNRCNAQELTIGTPIALDLACASAEADEPVPPLDASGDPQSQDGWFDDSFGGSPAANNTAWFSFIAPSSGNVSIQTDGMDTQLALYSSSDNTCTGEMTLIAANDDGGTFDENTFAFLGSVINKPYCYEAGKRYFIQVDLPLYFFSWQGTILLTATWNIPVATATGNVLSSDAPEGNQWYDQNGPIPGATSQEYTATVTGNYYTVVTVDGCSTAPSNSVNIMVSGVGTPNHGWAVNVYPNPVTDNMTLEITGNTRQLPYKVINSLGQCVKEGEIKEKALVDMQQFPPGIYSISINQGGDTIKTKIVKK